jgi:putative NIF3 family GTP cyclohydrolase 1 type 2
MNFVQLKEKLSQIFSSINLKKFPNEWGLNIVDNENPILKIGYAVSLHPYTIEQANKHNVNLLVTHHDAWPFLFDLREDSYSLLKRYNLNHLFVHGPLDQISFGTSGALIDKIGAKYVDSFDESDGLIWGKIGELSPSISFSTFQNNVTQIIGYSPREMISGEKEVRRIGVVTGGGSIVKDIKAARDKGCDTYITGEPGLYLLLYAKWSGINTLIYGHNNTEIFGVENFVKELVANEPKIEIIKLKDENY